MATPSPYQPLFVFDSAASEGHFTRLQIDPNEGSIISIGMYPSGNPSPPVFDFPFSPASTPAARAAHGLPLFLIQFSRYDLGTNILCDPENTAAQDFIEYSVDPALIRAGETFVTVERAAGSGRIIYDKVQPSHTTNLSDSLKDPLDPIKVVLRFSRPAGRINAGWINLDISYTYPKQFREARDKFAWQATLAFPRLKIDKRKTVRERPGGSPTKDWSVLLPGGDVGIIKDLNEPQFHDMPVQLGALFKPDPGADLLRAVAVMATDVLGHKKIFSYKHRDPEEKDPTSDVMACNFVAPIHLLNRRYAQPVDPKNRSFNFTLSGGDRYGFGGGRTFYRIRALQVKGNGAPLDWTDVANVYRNWAKVNRPSYFTKVVPRAPNAQGPMDTMSPTTVITNYGLDGPLSPSSGQQDLARWLEIHPIKIDEQTDVANNQNVTLQDRLAEIRQRLNNSRNEAKLEAQIWGYELGGYYQWIAGYPPITSVLSNVEGKSDRFRAAMDELAGSQVFPNITTDFVRVLFNRKRFGGHVVWDGSKWVEAITEAFPAAFTDPLRNPNQATCQIITSGGLYNNPHDHSQGSTQRNRVFLIKTNEEELVQESQPGCADAETLYQYPQLGPYGIVVGGSAVLGKRIYQQDLLALCPQDDVLRIYLDKCLNNGALKYGARLMEFMKPTFDFCYDKTHRHIFAAAPSQLYNNVIGFGPWVTFRFQQVVKKIQRLGQGLDPRADGVKDQSFALTREFVPFEPMLPYFNEYYGRSTVLQYVYGEAISVKVTPGFVGAPYRHPGYKDRRKPVPIPASALDFMLKTDTKSEAGLLSREQLRQKCVAYFNEYFEVESHGLAPRNYDTGGGTSYTYNRIVEDVFNLKAYFFTLGAEAVIGERLHVPSIWFDPPTEPNEEAIKMAARAAQLHLRFAKFLRGGYILGQTKILSDNSTLYARSAGFRSFDDAVDFKSVVTGPAALDVGPDFISRGVDKDEFCSVSRSPRIHHQCWQRKVGAGLRTLYLFANVGNTPTPLKFSYTRGLDSTAGWKKAITIFDGRDSLGVDLQAAPVTLGSTEGSFIPTASNLAPRSFAAVLIFK